MVRPGPQAYFIYCEDTDISPSINVDDNQVVNAGQPGNDAQKTNETLDDQQGFGRSRTASPYIEENHGKGTILRRRVIDQIPKSSATTTVIDSIICS